MKEDYEPEKGWASYRSGYKDATDGRPPLLRHDDDYMRGHRDGEDQRLGYASPPPYGSAAASS